jgi:hypothetical protein
MPNRPSHTRRALVWLLLLGLALPLRALADGADDFTGAKNPEKWGDDVPLGEGVLTQTEGRLEYTCANPLNCSDTFRPWKLTRFPSDADWEIQVDTFNSTVPDLEFEVNSAGLVLLHPTRPDTEVSLELYASSLGAPDSVRKGFDADMETDDVKVGDVDSGGLVGSATVNGALRVTFASATKVVTLYYDLDLSDGRQWTQLASFGIAGTGGADGNSDWALAATDQITLYLFGYADGMVVTSGEIFLDNFAETGGVGSTGGPTPVPTGSFGFGFPKGNPLLAAIFSIIGNYRGVTPTTAARNYSFDVTQDESGKLSAIGTIDGVVDRDGNPEISGIGGTIRTVNDEPTVKAQGNFKGTRDGDSATVSFKATAPVELAELSALAEGLNASLTYRSTFAGVPFSGRDVPIQIPTPIGATDNLRQDWNLRIDLTTRTAGKKEQIVATAQLTLPTGDILQYPEKVVRYSTSKGYRLKFRRAINVASIPPKVDPKAKITIKGLTFVQQGNAWEPTAGQITYQFLGQKGQGSLLDFVR